MSRRCQDEAARFRAMARAERRQNAEWRRTTRELRPMLRLPELLITVLVRLVVVGIYEIIRLALGALIALVILSLRILRFAAIISGRTLSGSCVLGWGALRKTLSFIVALSSNLGSRRMSYRTTHVGSFVAKLWDDARRIRLDQIYRRLSKTYATLPDWGQPIVWGVCASIPIVLIMIALRMAL